MLAAWSASPSTVAIAALVPLCLVRAAGNAHSRMIAAGRREFVSVDAACGFIALATALPFLDAAEGLAESLSLPAEEAQARKVVVWGLAAVQWWNIMQGFGLLAPGRVGMLCSPGESVCPYGLVEFAVDWLTDLPVLQPDEVIDSSETQSSEGFPYWGRDVGGHEHSRARGAPIGRRAVSGGRG